MSEPYKKCFELIEGNHNKFWTVEVVGKTYLATFGRIGTQGQTQVKTLATEYQAREKASDMIEEKRRKGYCVTTTDHPGASADLLESLGILRAMQEMAK